MKTNESQLTSIIKQQSNSIIRDNSYNLAQTLENEIIAKLNQKTDINSRQKHGLINAPGSIVKAITRKLRPRRYKRRKNRERLSSQAQIKTQVKDQMTLFEKSIATFQDNTHNLTNKQKIKQCKICESFAIEQKSVFFNFRINAVKMDLISQNNFCMFFQYILITNKSTVWPCGDNIRLFNINKF